jgi:hypothetical protein
MTLKIVWNVILLKKKKNLLKKKKWSAAHWAGSAWADSMGRSIGLTRFDPLRLIEPKPSRLGRFHPYLQGGEFWITYLL